MDTSQHFGERSPTPDSDIPPTKRATKRKAPPVDDIERTVKRKSKKKAAVVYSDDDDDDDDEDEFNEDMDVDDLEFDDTLRKQMEDKDEDEDFMPASPPRKAATKKASAASAPGKKSKAKRQGSTKATDTPIAMKDERKTVLATSSTTVSEAKLASSLKRSLTTASDTMSISTSQATVDDPVSPQVSKGRIPVPPTRSKPLPTIKKYKQDPSAASSAAATPSTSNVSALARKPTQTGLPRTVQAADVDLGNSDIYKSLFKTVSNCSLSK